MNIIMLLTFIVMVTIACVIIAIGITQYKSAGGKGAIASTVQLRAAIIAADTTLSHGDLGEYAVRLARIRADADDFARAQVSPDAALAAMAWLDESLQKKYPTGHWIVHAALVRESARRREAV